MADVVETVTVRIKPDGTQQTVTAIRTVERAANGLSKKVHNVRFNADGSKTITTMTRQVQALNKEIRSTTASFSLFGRIVASVAIADSIRRLIGLTDTLTSLQSRLAVVDSGVGGVALNMERLIGVGDRARVPLESLVTVFGRTTRAMEGFGKSGDKVTKFTETLAKAVQLGGSTSVEASNAMIQLSQGMSSGTLRGDELRSVMEQLPVVARLIATEFGTTTGGLKKLGAEGKLVTERVFAAILKSGRDIDKQFSNMKMTVAQAWEVFKNHATEAAGAFQNSAGKIAEILVTLAKNFDLVIAGAQSLAQVLGVALAAKAIQATIVGFTSLAAMNPFIAIGAAIITATAAMSPFLDEIKLANGGLATMQDLSTVTQRKISNRTEEIGQDIGKAYDDAFNLDDLGRDVEAFFRNAAKAADMLINPLLQIQFLWAEIASALQMDPENKLRQNFRDNLSRGTFSSMAGGAAETVSKSADRLKAEAEGEAGLRKAEEDYRKLMDEQDKTEAHMRDRQRVLSERQEARSKTPAAGKASGKTMEDILRELNDTLQVLRTPLDEERIIRKRAEAEMDKLGKGRSSTPDQRALMEDLIRQQEGIRIGKEMQAEQEKRINESLEERLRQQVELIEGEQKISLELGKQEEKSRRDHAREVEKSDREKRKDLRTGKEVFEDDRAEAQGFVNRNPDQFEKANTAFIQSMKGAQLVGEAFDGVAVSIADATANAIVFGDSLSQSLNMIAKQLTASLISKLLQIGVGSALGGLGIGTAAPMIAGGLTRPVGSGAKGGYFNTGGYTGNGGRGDIAGVVHGREFVVNANATARNRATLESMNAGRPAGGMNVTVQNYGGVQVEATQLTPNDVQIMIKKGIAQQAPAAIAADMANGSSKTSKALKRHFGVNKNI